MMGFLQRTIQGMSRSVFFGAISAVAALCSFLAYAQQGSDCCSATENRVEGVASRLIEELRPSVRAAGRVAGRGAFQKGRGWISPEIFEGPFGILIDKSCFDWSGDSAVFKKKDPQKIIQTILDMHETVQACASKTALPATVLAFYEKLAGLSVVCQQGGCSNSRSASACAYPEKRKVIFIKPEGLVNASMWFHELLHIGKYSENLETSMHNKQRALDGKPIKASDEAEQLKVKSYDEVYFWQEYCFTPNALLIKVRVELEVQMRKQKLSLPADARKIEEAAYGACELPLSYSGYKKKHRLGPVLLKREYHEVCRPFVEHVLMEWNLSRIVAENIYSQVLVGVTEGVDRVFLDQMARYDYFWPPISRPIDFAGIAAWADKMCATSSFDGNRRNIAGLVYACAANQVNRLSEPEEKKRLSLAGFSEAEIDRMSFLYTRLMATSREISNIFGDVEKFGPGQQTAEAVHEKVKRVLEVCDGNKKTLFSKAACAEMRVNSPSVRLLARLLTQWQPRKIARK